MELLEDLGAALGGLSALPKVCGGVNVGSDPLAFKVWKLPTPAMLFHLSHAKGWAIVTLGAGARDEEAAS